MSATKLSIVIRLTHSDPSREDAQGDYDRREPAKAPENQLDVSEQTFGGVKDVVKKTRTASAPGPNAIPYNVFDVLTTSKAVMETPESSLEEGDVPDSWKKAEGINIYTKGTIFQDG